MQRNESDKKYLSHKEEDLIKELAQKEYNQKTLECAKKEYQVIKKLNKLYENSTLEDIYGKITVGKRKYINPERLPDDLYIEKWNAYKYVGLEFREGTSEYYSDKGERMRSKSEVLIANTLKRKGIPYRYECPLKLKQGEVFYPDFTILNVKERKDIYWEHFGLMDEHDYRERSFSKIT